VVGCGGSGWGWKWRLQAGNQRGTNKRGAVWPAVDEAASVACQLEIPVLVVVVAVVVANSSDLALSCTW
jgi:hypothetical protein